MLTDSGGYQAFSLSGRRTFCENGFVFRSHLDGSARLLSAEVAMAVQAQLGADIAMQLDVCPPGDASRAEIAEACNTTTRWAKRCLEVKSSSQALFGIVQGGTHVDLRAIHAEELGSMPFDGLALGGFSVGEPIARMHELLGDVAALLDVARPRYLMGVGTPRDLVLAIGAGLDMFDCVLPTRNARNGHALLRHGRIVIKQARYRDDPLPLDSTCQCPACAGGFSRAYLRHLFLAKEILVLRLLSVHNLHVYGQLVAEARRAIHAGAYARFAREWLNAGVADGKADRDGDDAAAQQD
jgi:queuine tRNA-ribosyltransferase